MIKISAGAPEADGKHRRCLVIGDMVDHGRAGEAARAHMGRARAEEELAREIIQNKAQLNLVGGNHTLSVFSIVKKSAKEPVKLVYCSGYKSALGYKLRTLLLGRLPLGLRSIRKKLRTKIRPQKL